MGTPIVNLNNLVQSSVDSSFTDEVIKNKYENNLDTNAYTDAEKSLVGVGTVLNTTANNLTNAINEIHGELDSHVSNDGSDHTFIDQDVTTSGTPSFGSVQLNGGAGEQGKLSWNADEETVDLIQNGSTLQIGQEVHYHVRNNTGSTIANGTPVYATGTLGNSGRITVAPFIADGSIPESFFLGVTTEEIPNDTDGKVTYFGKVRGINTSAFSEGDVLYVSPSTAGSLTSTHPTGSDIALPIAFVISSASNGTLFVRSTNLNDNKYAKASHAHTISEVNGLQTALDGKVDDSQVLTDVPADAVFTDTVYTHPTHPGNDIDIDTGPLIDAVVISDLDFNITTDGLGHVTDASASIVTRSLTAADIGALSTTGTAADSDKLGGLDSTSFQRSEVVEW